jgi:CheY-like chemotaxis protein
MAYQSASRHITGSYQKPSGKPKVTIVIESLPLLQELIFDYEKWLLPIDVNFFDSVTEALLDLSNSKPDMLVVEMSMPRAQQEKTFQALENFNQRGNSPLSVVLITQEKSLSNGAPVSANSSIQLVSGPLSSVWLHAYLTGVIASCRT